MKIAIDATPLLLRSAGIKSYLVHWILSMRQVGSDTILAWPALEPRLEYSHERSVVGPAATAARIAFVQAVNRIGFLPGDLLAPRVDVFHASHHMWQSPKRCKLTATIFDMTCWLIPETHQTANVKALHRFGEVVLRRADGLIAISRSSRDDAVRILGLDPERIAVIHPGVPEAYFQVTQEEASRIRSKYGLLKPYCLFVGTIEPRKNVDGLLDAWQMLDGDLRLHFELVIAGPQGWARPATLARLAQPGPGVRYLGYVPEKDMPGLTAGAYLLVYPSLYEGFGLPLGQAMAAGVPVVTSNVSAMPEVAGDAGLLVDPRSPREIAQALAKVLGAPEVRESLAIRARARAQLFRWENSARQSLDWFHRLAG